MDDSDDLPWDEDRWERAFQENDLRTDKLMLLHETFRAQHPAPPAGAPEAERADWRRALERFLARQMGWDDLAADLDRQPPGAAGDSGTGDLGGEDPDSVEDPLYEAVNQLTAPIIQWHKSLPPNALDDEDVQELWVQSLTVGAKVAGAGAYTAPHALGGRVAALKRALTAANAALDALEALRGHPATPPATHGRLAALVHEMREAVALAVLDARARFEGA